MSVYESLPSMESAMEITMSLLECWETVTTPQWSFAKGTYWNITTLQKKLLLH
jgi:hypothetical protein